MNWDEIEHPNDRGLRLMIEECNRKRDILIPQLKEGELICNHLDPHIVPVVTGAELQFRTWMEKMGWLGYSGGYCAAYYPKWLRHAFRITVNKELPVLEDEPAYFNEGGKWKP